MTDSNFLEWLRERLINVYKENPNTDFVLKLEDVTGRVKRTEEARKALAILISYAKN